MSGSLYFFSGVEHTEWCLFFSSGSYCLKFSVLISQHSHEPWPCGKSLLGHYYLCTIKPKYRICPEFQSFLVVGSDLKPDLDRNLLRATLHPQLSGTNWPFPSSYPICDRPLKPWSHFTSIMSSFYDHEDNTGNPVSGFPHTLLAPHQFWHWPYCHCFFDNEGLRKALLTVNVCSYTHQIFTKYV